MSNSGAAGQLFIVAAPSGAGKTSLVNELLRQDPRLVLSVSHTTRPARSGERDGEQYHFVSPAVFRRMAAAGEFLEHARVFDHDYGTSRRAVERELEAGRDVLLEIDWQGARQVRRAFPGCCSIFILPPTLETLRDRLAARAQDSAATIRRRMQDARAELSHWDEFDHLVVNDRFDRAVAELRSIIGDRRAGRPHPISENDRNLAQQLGKS